MNKHGLFNIDWRLTEPPKAGPEQLDLSFLFDIGAEQSRCSLPNDTPNY